MTGTSVFVLSPDFPKLDSYAMLHGAYRDSIIQAKRLGYDGIEIILGDPARLDPDEILALVGQQGLAVSALNSGGIEYMFHASLVNDDPAKCELALSFLKHSIGHCSRLGCLQQIGVARGFAVPGRSMRWYKDRLVEALRELTSYARQFGVQIVFEYTNRFEINTINTSTEALEIVTRVGASNLGILLDTYHSYIEDPDVCQNILDLGGAVKHFHLHDSNGGAAIIGGGENRFDDIIKACAETGYQGWFSDGLRTCSYTEAEVLRSTSALSGLYARYRSAHHERAAGVVPVASR